uniref:Reverse transcriptase Ty1/copia-type domain-containing protein n=1 Tax=Peronospora matthiolae TaxID=2874970 RepID=A0AAV1VNB0_9STRA
MYGLKQAARSWIQLLHARLQNAGFSQCVQDMCSHWKIDDSQLVVVGVYVGDLLATRTSTAAVYRFFTQLESPFIKELSIVSRFLKMRVAIDGNGSCVLDRSEAIGELWRWHGLNRANSTRAPIRADCYEVHPEDSALLGASGEDGGPSIRTFQFLVGSLLWVERCMWLEITFAVRRATHQTHQPRLHNLKLAKRIAR